jgi:hypothetical protein
LSEAKWELTPSPVCTLFEHVLETQAHIKCVSLCPALNGEQILVHYCMVLLHWGSIEKATQGWSFHRESTVEGVDGMRGTEAPLNSMAKWQKMCDEMMHLFFTTVFTFLPLFSTFSPHHPLFCQPPFFSPLIFFLFLFFTLKPHNPSDNITVVLFCFRVEIGAGKKKWRKKKGVWRKSDEQWPKSGKRWRIFLYSM